MKLPLWLKKDNWETVMNKTCKAKYSVFGIVQGSTNAVLVVQIERTKKKVKVFLTNGNTTSSMDIHYTVGQHPELKQILEDNDIKY